MNFVMADDIRTRQRTREEAQAAVKQQTEEGTPFGKCPKCGAPTVPDFELCPNCGAKLVDYCTFCGAMMGPDDMDCPECGMPSEGMECPDCKIINYRPFCRACGRPLSRAARKAVEKAKMDPKVREAARAMVRISELQAELDSAACKEEYAENQEPTEGKLRLDELMSKVGFTTADMPSAKRRKMGRSREEVMAEYARAVEEANRIFEEMLPPAGMTPQEQRNYYTARKVAVMETIEESWYEVTVSVGMYWECNKCHVKHNNPSECYVREFGGKWIQDKITRVVPEGTPGAVKYTKVVGERKVYKRE